MPKEAAKTLKTKQDLSDFNHMLKNITVEAPLNGEIDDHLGYEKHQISDNNNSRNGHSSKTLYTDDGPFAINVPLINKAIYLALGVDLEGQKKLLGMWLSENERRNFG